MSASARRAGAAPQVPTIPPNVATQLLTKLEEYHPGQLIAWLHQHIVVVEDVPLPAGGGSAEGEDEEEDLYAALQVSPNADAAEIRKAYRRLALVTHPDKPAGDPQRFLSVSRAYATLGDPRQREAYDWEQHLRRKRAEESQGCCQRPLQRMRLRPGREVLVSMAQDLGVAGAAMGEALGQLLQALRAVREKGAAAGAGGAGVGAEAQRRAPPAGAAGGDFL